MQVKRDTVLSEEFDSCWEFWDIIHYFGDREYLDLVSCTTLSDRDFFYVLCQLATYEELNRIVGCTRVYDAYRGSRDCNSWRSVYYGSKVPTRKLLVKLARRFMSQ